VKVEQRPRGVCTLGIAIARHRISQGGWHRDPLALVVVVVVVVVGATRATREIYRSLELEPQARQGHLATSRDLTSTRLLISLTFYFYAVRERAFQPSLRAQAGEIIMRVPERKVPDDVSSYTRDANERLSGETFSRCYYLRNVFPCKIIARLAAPRVA